MIVVNVIVEMFFFYFKRIISSHVIFQQKEKNDRNIELKIELLISYFSLTVRVRSKFEILYYTYTTYLFENSLNH